MFGNDNGGDGGHDHDGFSFGQALFALWLWRELDSGRIDGGQVFKAIAVIFLVIAGGGLLLLVIASASMPRYDSSLDPYATSAWPTEAPAYAPAWTPRPTRTPAPTATPTPTPKPTPIPGIGKKVAAGDGWFVTVTKVERWKPSWYKEPGWRLITARVTVGMPAVDFDCAWSDMFSVTAPSGREYRAWIEGNREPALFACSDYHRRTTDKGWVTFEVRDADAKGLVLTFCMSSVLGCDDAPRIRLK